MKNIRIIPRLDIKGPNVVKPVQTEALRIVGNPKELAFRYYQGGADELIYLDIVASLYQRNLDFDLLKSVTENIFIPITVGGGIRSIYDINNVLRSGADKIAVNTYAVKNPDFLSEAVKEFGSQCIVLYVEAKKQAGGNYEVYTDGGREKTGIDVIGWIKQAIDLGVGEILLTSVDREGTRAGYDLELLKQVSGFSPIPVIAHGGAGSLESFKQAIFEARVDALGVSSVFQYNDFSIGEVKKYLSDNNINVRIV
ncbi:MAG: imidazole glycerol phosphate synthase cyclase subunit [Patescibacteria group bacterium]|nr:imidazole glycerol phosphate synthase cyclase subunit [Patescibacteria group bacterium]